MPNKQAVGVKNQTQTPTTDQQGVSSWDQDPFLVDVRFGGIVAARQAMRTMELESAAKRKELDEQIVAYLMAAEIKKVMWNGEPVQYIESHSPGRLDRTVLQNELVMAGVDADVIKRCTDAAWKPGSAYIYVSVGNKGDASKRGAGGSDGQ